MLFCALGACRLEINTGTDVNGSGDFTSQYHSLGSFSQLKMNGVGDAKVMSGSSESITIEADQNILPYVTADVIDHVLVVSVQSGVNIHPSRTIRYTIVTRNLNSAILNGTGNLSITGMDTNNSGVTLNGAGNIDISGNCGYFTALIAGTGDIDASGLKAKTAYATIQGTGNITAWTTDYLNAVISGVGNISYYGNPYLDKSVTGIGSVKWLGY